MGFGITDDEVVKKASEQEIIRRYFKTGCDYKKGNTDLETFKRAEFIMHSLGLKEEDRKVVTFARKRLELLNEEKSDKNDKQKTLSAIAFEMPDGKIITGKKSSLMDAPSAAILNSLKYLSNFDDELLLISPTILEPIIKLKEKTLKNKHIPLDCEEILIALSITAATNSMAEVALSKLSQLEGVQAHSTHILGRNDEQSLRKLGIDVTSDQVFPTENLYYNQ